MQIKILNQKANIYSPTFSGMKVPRETTKKVSEKVFERVSASLAASGIAGIALNDYFESIKKPIDKLDITEEDSKVIAEIFEEYPILMDTFLYSKNSRGYTREVSVNSLKKAVASFEINPDLTLELLGEIDEEGGFKYTINNISQIISANELDSNLFEYSKKFPNFVAYLSERINDSGEYSYGINDIIDYCEIYEEDKVIADVLARQKDKDGKARFNGEQAKFILENRENPFVMYLFNITKDKIKEKVEHYRFNGKEIQEISNACKTKEDKSFVLKLLKVDIPNRITYNTKLSGDTITTILKEDSVNISKSLANVYYKHNLLEILKLKDEALTIDQIFKMLSMKDEYNMPLFTDNDIKQLKTEDDLNVITMYKNRRLTISQLKKVYEISKICPKLIEQIFDKTYKIKAVKYSNFIIKPEEIEYKFEDFDIKKLLEFDTKQVKILSIILDFLDGTDLSYTYFYEKEIMPLIDKCMTYASKMGFDTLKKSINSYKALEKRPNLKEVSDLLKVVYDSRKN